MPTQSCSAASFWMFVCVLFASQAWAEEPAPLPSVAPTQTSATQAELLEPAADRLLLIKETSRKVDFGWKSSELPPNSKLEVASDLTFKSVEKSIVATGRTEVTEVRLELGKHYWRIASEGTPLSETRLLEIAKDQEIQLKLPAHNAKMDLDPSRPQVQFKWDAPPYFDKLTLEIAQDAGFKQIVQSVPVSQEGAEAPLKRSASVFWRVRGETQRLAKSDVTSLTRKLEIQWKGPAAASLASPKARAPIGSIVLAKGRPVSLEWEPVENAVAYRVQLEPVSEGEFQPKSWTVTETAVNALELPIGMYRWKVAALPSEDPKAKEAGPTTTSEFDLALSGIHVATDEAKVEAEAPSSPDTTGFKPGGYAALSTMLAPYNYEVVSPRNGRRGTTSSYSYTLRGSGEYWFKPRWSGYVAVERSFLSFDQGQFGRSTFELTAKYRRPAGADAAAWILMPKAGLEYRDYVHVIPSAFTGQIESFTVGSAGLSVGFDLRKQMNETLSLGIKTSYFLPLILTGAPYPASLSSEASYRNMSVGAQIVYFWRPEWSLGAGAYFETRSISFIPEGRTMAEEIYTDGMYFFGSLIYTFGM